MEIFAFVIAVLVASLILLKLLVFLFCCLSIYVIEHKKKVTKSGFESVSQSPSKLKHAVANVYGGIYRYFVFKIGRVPFRSFRMFIYKHIFQMNIGKKVMIFKGLEIRGGTKITIGDNTIIGDDCLLDGRGGLSIGKNVNFSSKASVYTEQHLVNDSNFKSEKKPVVIGDRAWISSNSVVLPGVNVREGAILACGGVATKDLNAFTIYGGVPAKAISERNKNISYEFDGKGPWFS